jgi:hypothetical protein
MEEKFMTLHPQGKSGVNISKGKYELVRRAIEESLGEEAPMSFSGLRDVVSQRLEGRFEGSISWYYTTVKLDLEARGVVERVPGTSPQMLRLSKTET